MLDGTIQGRIVVDEPVHPTLAFLQDLTEGNTYLGGAMTPAALNEAAENIIGYCLIQGETILCEVEAGPLIRGVAGNPPPPTSPKWMKTPFRGGRQGEYSIQGRQ
jgi:hypothetical protein